MGIIEDVFHECSLQLVKCEKAADATKSELIQSIERDTCSLLDRDCLYVGVSKAFQPYQVK